VPFGLGIWEILILAGVLVLLFGAKGAPGMARRLGAGVKEMKDAVGELDPRSLFDADDPPAAAPKKAIEAPAPAPAQPAPPPAQAAATPPAARADVAERDDEPPVV
jgi:sec-independent protein translocase protein TatA